MKSIALVGFMGSGKSSVGKKLTDYLNIPFYDTDEVVENQLGMQIKDIFKRHGEDYFREVEEEVLLSMPSDGAVIATGGGIVESPVNRETLKNNFNSIWLQASFPTISKRLEADAKRPLWNNNDQLKHELFRSRQNLYQQSTVKIIKVDELEIDECAQEILCYLNL
ncbi:shikimate kinase [Alkalibacillus aidingensis]|uniref:shikimate kinase n=1 Tax=Alkalibacillus aidingensis TaxID=2747607 RepID=UPI00166166AC|nr:shikimate kinase [Alkalibacillus aidingensis]